MSSHEPRRSRLFAALLGLSAAALASAALAAPAGALTPAPMGSAAILTAGHKKGRTLSGQGVKLALSGGSSEANELTLPVGELKFGAQPSAQTATGLTFRKGRRSVAFTDLRFDLAAGTLAGKRNGNEVPLFWLGAAPQVNATAGSVSLTAGKLRLTAETAKALKSDLGLQRALVRKGVGMVWLSAQAHPTQVARTIASGSVNWDFLTAWREYVYKELGPGSIGTITTAGGAAITGDPAKAGAFFTFPGSGGSFAQGLYGAATTLALKTGGSVKFAKPGHCINEIVFANLEVRIDGAGSALVGDLSYDIDKPGMSGCEDQPPVSAPGTTIATLGAVSPSYSADGKTATWANVPATLTAVAAKPFEPKYKGGQVLDPLTITVGLG